VLRKFKSNASGNYRIRSYSHLKAESDAFLVQTKGENSHPFYKVPQIKKPLISPKAKLETVMLKNTFLYNIETVPGNAYILSEL
jgi:alpha-L-fucosidase 2